MNGIAEYIRQNVPMGDICKKYGFAVNRAGFIFCPFHREKTASLRIYTDAKGSYCFGCGQGGSNIDFVERLFNKDFKEAVKIIATAFNLPIVTNKSSYRDKLEAQKRFSELTSKAIARQEKRLAAEIERDRLLNEWVRNDIIIMNLKPKTPCDELLDVYVRAMQSQPIIEYKLDSLEVN